MDGNGWKQMEMTKMAGNGWIGWNGWKWLEMAVIAGHDQKWLEIA